MGGPSPRSHKAVHREGTLSVKEDRKPEFTTVAKPLSRIYRDGKVIPKRRPTMRPRPNAVAAEEPGLYPTMPSARR
jgi:hypothetical protein